MSLAVGTTASGGLSANVGSVRAKEFLDPIIEIDPTFEFRDSVRLVFDDNTFAPAPSVPEPCTQLLLASGTVGMIV